MGTSPGPLFSLPQIPFLPLHFFFFQAGYIVVPCVPRLGLIEPLHRQGTCKHRVRAAEPGSSQRQL